MNRLLYLAFFLFTGFPALSQEGNKDSVKWVEPKSGTLDKSPAFPGGDPSWRIFLERYLNPNVSLEHGSPYGRFIVIVRFIVEKDSSLSDIKALTQHGYGLEEEVINLIKKSGHWEPAILDGHPVRAYREQTIIFLVNEDGLNMISEDPYTLHIERLNKITVDFGKLKPEDYHLTINQGSLISNGDGTYQVKVSQRGKAIIKAIHNLKGREIGKWLFDVVD